MCRAFALLEPGADMALVDGLTGRGLTFPHRAVVKGDSLSLSIAAASIIAKVTRDRLMRALHEEFPGYGWFTNKGYGTEEHLFALNRLGPCRHHRRSFAPVYQLLRPVDSVFAEAAAGQNVSPASA
jgi:ribonuclease HII